MKRSGIGWGGYLMEYWKHLSRVCGGADSQLNDYDLDMGFTLGQLWTAVA